MPNPALAGRALLSLLLFSGLLNHVECLGHLSRKRRYPIGSTGNETPRSKELLAQCTLRWQNSRLDHFSWANTATFKQRYFVCDKYWKNDGSGVIFFYLGKDLKAPKCFFFLFFFFEKKT